MRTLLLLLVATLLFAACSKQEERSRRAGKDIAKKMKAPIEETRSVTDKIKATHQTDLPE